MQLTLAVLDSYNYLEQPCICLCNYCITKMCKLSVSVRYNTVAHRIQLHAADCCVSHILDNFGKELRFSGI